MNTKFYKYCAVPISISTTICSLDKLFIHVAKDKNIRNNWLTLTRRDPTSLMAHFKLFL